MHSIHTDGLYSEINRQTSSTGFARGLMGLDTGSDSEIANMKRSPIYRLLHKLFPSKSSVIQRFEDGELDPGPTADGANRLPRLFPVSWMVHLIVTGFLLLFVVYKIVYFTNCFMWKRRDLIADRWDRERQFAQQCTGEWGGTEACILQQSRLHESIVLKSIDFALHTTLANTDLYIASKKIVEVAAAAALPWMSVLVPVLIVCLVTILLAFTSHVYKTAVFGMARRDFITHLKNE